MEIPYALMHHSGDLIRTVRDSNRQRLGPLKDEDRFFGLAVMF
ncbi:hypothetical protein ACWDV4_18425 [Micromonospora sp. NPDC003197]